MEGEDGEKIKKDRILDKNGKILIEEIEERGRILLNGNWERDQDGEFTYIGKQGHSVIDYGVVNIQAGQHIEYFRIEKRTESFSLTDSFRIKSAKRRTSGLKK